MAKFELGKVMVTCGVMEKIKESEKFNEFTKKSLERHSNGDWGDLCKEDKFANEVALANGDDRLFSKYDYDDDEESIYIITEWDRSVTTILFPSEY